jgi:primase-polymerase (primpol)-like protein
VGLPQVPPFSIDAIPEGLKRRRQWICWRYSERDNKVVKVPVAPWVTGDDRPVSVTDPNNCADFDKAVDYARKYGFGLGFAFFKGAGIAGIDLDKLIELGQEAQEMIKKANSYAEYSPSGKGVHILGFGNLSKAIKREGLEAYDRDRFFTVTGNHVEGTPLTLGNIQPLLDELEAKYGEKPIAIIVKETPGGGWEGYVNDLGWTLREVREKDRILDEYLKGGLAGKP